MLECALVHRTSFYSIMRNRQKHPRLLDRDLMSGSLLKTKIEDRERAAAACDLIVSIGVLCVYVCGEIQVFR